MSKFNQSLTLDKRMWKQDIEGSQAYARALHKAKILTTTEQDLIIAGLHRVKLGFPKGQESGFVGV